MGFLSSLQLHHYRSYEHVTLGSLPAGFLVFFGANGAGKTNILEGVSMLSPGRGLRGARAADMQRRCASGAADAPPAALWAVSSLVQAPYGPVQIGTGLDAKADKRVVRVQGRPVRGQKALAEHLSCLWLTPQMDRIFLDSAGQRRRFFDRMVFAFDPGHLGRVTRYENAMRKRARVLQERGACDPAWLAGLEAQMAETAVAIAAARLDFAARLQAACDRLETPSFPRARIQAQGALEGLLGSASALEVEELFRYQLCESRGVDMLTGGAATGPHKSDLAVFYAAKDMPAAQCSTGEQKALLIGLVLAHAQLVRAERGAPPVLLLDEVAAHLDASRRGALYELLGALGAQVWLTGTDKRVFRPLARAAESRFFEVREGSVKAA